MNVNCPTTADAPTPSWALCYSNETIRIAYEAIRQLKRTAYIVFDADELMRLDHNYEAITDEMDRRGMR